MIKFDREKENDGVLLLMKIVKHVGLLANLW